jgi:hypothetical protein
MTHAGGRPTDYDPKIIPRVLECMRAGWSLAELCLEFDVSKKTLYNWRDAHPEFLHALENGVDLSEGWHMKLARENYYNKDFNDRLWYRNMANRFGWRDKTENNNNTTISFEDGLKELE